MAQYYDEGGAVYNVMAYGADGTGTVDDWNSIDLALTAATPPNGPGGTVYFPGGTYWVGSATEVPRGVGFTFSPNAKLRMTNGPLTVRGTIRAGLYAIVDDVTVYPNPITFDPEAIPEVYPEWFGAVADGQQDCGPAIQAAVDSLPARGGVVWFSTGTYLVDSEIVVAKSGVRFVGGARQGKPGVPDTGSHLQPGANLGQAAMVRFAKAPAPADGALSNAMGCGISGLSFVNEDGERRWTMRIWLSETHGYL